MIPVGVAALKEWLHDGGEIALLDVREHGEYGVGHLLYAVPLPFSRLEAELDRLVPRKSARLVVYDDGRSNIAREAAKYAELYGYSDVCFLEGGMEAWTAAGHEVFAGVNVVSKTFGEIVEHAEEVPSITAADLDALRKTGRDVIVVDGRPVDEYRKMNIPGSICCPNGELAYRIDAIAPDPATTIVMNCAGRTRSIVGAATLRRLGVPNPVLALRNGTMGWSLAGFDLEHGSNRLYPTELPQNNRPMVRDRARQLATRHGVPFATPTEMSAWLSDPGRTTYVLDVRTETEFRAGTVPGAVWAPGGQLIQATDQWIGVRNSRVILVDDDEVRASIVAAWLRDLRWEAYVLRGGIAAAPAPDGGGETGRIDQALPDFPTIAAGDLPEFRPQAALLDIRPSMVYRSGHLAGAVWASRARLEEALRAIGGKPVVVIAGSPRLGRAFAMDLQDRGIAIEGVHVGTPAVWHGAGLETIATADLPPDSECIDYLFFVHDRHDGNLEAARQYLAWETGLVAKLDERERRDFGLDH